MIPTWLFIVVLALAGFWAAVALYAWNHAAKWSKLIAYHRIVIEYKGKVKIDAPLQEWALWCRMADRDKSGQVGHVLYGLGGTRIAILRGVKPAKPKPVKQRGGQQVRQGTWSATKEVPKP